MALSVEEEESPADGLIARERPSFEAEESEPLAEKEKEDRSDEAEESALLVVNDDAAESVEDDASARSLWSVVAVLAPSLEPEESEAGVVIDLDAESDVLDESEN